jgi:hypothetical protein
MAQAPHVHAVLRGLWEESLVSYAAGLAWAFTGGGEKTFTQLRPDFLAV